MDNLYAERPGLFNRLRGIVNGKMAIPLRRVSHGSQHDRSNTFPNERPGLFTLLEIVPVVSLIFLMAGVIYVLVNPAGNLENARNEQRRADLVLLSDAIAEYSRDEGTALLVNIPSTPIEICADAGGNNCGGKLSLNALLGEYLHEIPRDPSLNSSDPSDSDYTAQITSDRRVKLSALSAEGGATIEVIR